jgi:hypothetical protein
VVITCKSCSVAHAKSRVLKGRDQPSFFQQGLAYVVNSKIRFPSPADTPKHFPASSGKIYGFWEHSHETPFTHFVPVKSGITVKSSFLLFTRERTQEKGQRET